MINEKLHQHYNKDRSSKDLDTIIVNIWIILPSSDAVKGQKEIVSENENIEW